MRPLTAIAAAVAAIACAAAASVPAGAAKGNGIKGRVLDRTCYGICAPETLEPRPFRGEAKVVVRRLPGKRRAASAKVDESRFRERLRPGRYKLKLKLGDRCWEGDPSRARVTVERGEFERVRLYVVNRCIRERA